MPAMPTQSKPEHGRWAKFNRACYGAATWLQQLSVRPLPPAKGAHRGDGEAILFVAWGRIGDAILGTRVLDLLREHTGRRLVVAGRPEAASVLGAGADTFVPLPAARDAAALSAFASATAGAFHAAVTDLHFFHGGLPRLGAWFANVDARHHVAYAGYAPRQRVAPWRRWPAPITVIPALDKGDEVGDRHVLLDSAHYLQAVLTHLGVAGAVDVRELAPRLTLSHPPTTADFIACQPFSNNRKKDWPEAHWRRLFAAWPQRRFVLLGGAADRTRARALACANVDDRCGTTDLAGAVQIIAEASAFVGVDSGLAHAAAALRRPTLVVSHGSNLGYFFPYPSALGFDHVRVVHDERFTPCSGCIAACSQEPLWHTYRRGALCLRALDARAVAEALGEVLARGAPHPQPIAENTVAASRC